MNYITGDDNAALTLKKDVSSKAIGSGIHQIINQVKPISLF